MDTETLSFDRQKQQRLYDNFIQKSSSRHSSRHWITGFSPCHAIGSQT
jgi:hypothetical protein